MEIQCEECNQPLPRMEAWRFDEILGHQKCMEQANLRWMQSPEYTPEEDYLPHPQYDSWADAAREFASEATFALAEQLADEVRPYTPWPNQDEGNLGIYNVVLPAIQQAVHTLLSQAAMRHGEQTERFMQFLKARSAETYGAAPYGWHGLPERTRKNLHPEDPNTRPDGVVKGFPNPLAE